MGAAMIGLSRITMDWPPWRIALVLAFVGLGAGAFQAPNSSAVMGAAPAERRGLAAGTIATVRNVGMLLGISLVGAIFARYAPDIGQQLGDATTTQFAPYEAGLFTAGLRAACLASAVIAGIGAVLSSTRGPKPTANVRPETP